MSLTELHKVSKSFGPTRIIDALNLTANPGELLVIVGPSGCGKSTLLRMIAGLEPVSAGRILIDNIDVTTQEPSARGVAMVFQTYALYPHMTVRANMEFGLEMAGVPKAERSERVNQAAVTLRLEDYLDRKPKQLSGGQRQRVAIGRTIVRNPKVFLFDEPLSNLDAELRVQMRLEIARLHRELNATMIYVTHDQVEAMTLATRIVLLREGRIEQIGPPSELYANPSNTFVAGFIGSPGMNLLPATAHGIDDNGYAIVDVPSINLDKFSVPLTRPHHALPGQIIFGIRPEDLLLAADTGDFHIALRCELVEDLGSNVFLHSAASRDESIIATLPRGAHPVRGESVRFRIAEHASCLFDTNGLRL